MPPGKSISTQRTPTFRDRKIPKFDSNNLIMSWGQTKISVKNIDYLKVLKLKVEAWTDMNKSTK